MKKTTSIARGMLLIALLLGIAGLFSSCGDVFETHPYDVKVKGETGINAKQMAIIEKQFANKDTLRVAFISDTHLWPYNRR